MTFDEILTNVTDLLQRDGRVSYRALKLRFNLDDEATEKLVEAATAAEHEAVDLYHFTSNLNRSLDEAGRLRLIEMMWQIAFADGRVTEFEDNLIWRAADLLGVPSHERLALRTRVANSREPDAKAGAKAVK